MSRKTISYDNLIQWLNTELHKDEDYKDCDPTSEQIIYFSREYVLNET